MGYQRSSPGSVVQSILKLPPPLNNLKLSRSGVVMKKRNWGSRDDLVKASAITGGAAAHTRSSNDPRHPAVMINSHTRIDGENECNWIKFTKKYIRGLESYSFTYLIRIEGGNSCVLVGEAVLPNVLIVLSQTSLEDKSTQQGITHFRYAHPGIVGLVVNKIIPNAQRYDFRNFTIHASQLLS